MRGISSIISVILILMITIAMVAVAYTWFSGVVSELMISASSAITKTSTSMAIQFVMENAAFSQTQDKVYVSLRNTGPNEFDATKTAFYIDGMPEQFDEIDCPICDCNKLETGCIVNYNISTTVLSGSTLKATIEYGLQDSMEIKMID